jgi:hypothetical protein
LSNSPSQRSGIDSDSAAASQYQPVDWAAFQGPELKVHTAQRGG